VFLRSLLQLLITSNVVSSSLIFAIMVLLVILSSETSVRTRVTRRNIPEDGILHNHRRENHKSSIALTELDSVVETQCVSCDVRTEFLSQKIALFLIMKTSSLFFYCFFLFRIINNNSNLLENM
jgi:hypothetical protein